MKKIKKQHILIFLILAATLPTAYVFSQVYIMATGNSLFSAASASIPITNCIEIKNPGNYSVKNNLTSTSTGPCLYIHDTQSVYINCNKYLLSPLRPEDMVISEKNVKNFSIESCSIKTTEEGGGRASFSVKVIDSSEGSLKNNNFGDRIIDVRNSRNLKVANNIFRGSYEQIDSSNNVIENNVFVDSSYRTSNKAADVAISSIRGKNNIIRINSINGQAKTQEDFESKIGLDDGIVIDDESGDIIESNDLQNFWDCPIETNGLIQNTRISSNKMNNSGICGVGAWYYSSWRSNTVSNNLIDRAPVMFLFRRSYGLREGDSAVYFENNKFTSNRFTNPIEGRKGSGVGILYSSIFSLVDVGGAINGESRQAERTPAPSDFVIKNNIFTNNDFGMKQLAPLIEPQSLAVDGQGNKCNQVGYGDDYPLKCLMPYSIKLNFPNGGERLQTGSVQKIAWQTYGNVPDSSIILYLIDLDTKKETTITSLPKTTKFYQWQIPADVKLGENFKIRVLLKEEKTYNKLTSDVSDTAFSIFSKK